jgi:hypothetical protein
MDAKMTSPFSFASVFAQTSESATPTTLPVKSFLSLTLIHSLLWFRLRSVTSDNLTYLLVFLSPDNTSGCLRRLRAQLRLPCITAVCSIFLLDILHNPLKYSGNHTVTCMNVTIDGVWVGDSIY